MKVLKVFLMGISLTSSLATLGCSDSEEFSDFLEYNGNNNTSNTNQNSSEKSDPTLPEKTPCKCSGNKLSPKEAPSNQFLVNFYLKEGDIALKTPISKLAKVVTNKNSKLTFLTNPSPPTNKDAGFADEGEDNADYYAYFEGWHYRDDSNERKWNFKDDFVEKNLNIYGKWSETTHQAAAGKAKPYDKNKSRYAYIPGTLYALLYHEYQGRKKESIKLNPSKSILLK